MNDVSGASKKVNKMELTGQVARQVQIESVNLVELVCRNNASSDSEQKLEVSVEAETSTVYDSAEEKLVVNAKCVMDARPDGGEIAVRIAATFAVVYRLPVSDEFTQDYYNAFAEINGLFNLWPYWRELVQSTTMRMGLPPLTLPVRRVPANKGTRAKKRGPGSE